MMRRHGLPAAALVVSLIPISACGGSPEEDESRLGTAPSALLYDNALNLNALNLNALNLNALDSGALAAIQDPGSNGDLSRQLLQYAASCALDSTRSFSFSWTDAQGAVHAETYPGLIGLAPTWATQPLSLTGQQWVSACLISRVNYFGVHVTISARGPIAALNGNPNNERSTYLDDEGAFWGNIFLAAPQAFSCNYAPDVAYSRSQLRVCAAGYVDASGAVEPCGMIQMRGSCNTYCNGLQPAFKYYPKCQNPDGSSTPSVVTIYLP